MRRRDRPRRPNVTGRSHKTGRFVMLPNRLLESPAYASLDLVARALLTELVMLYSGDNNGSIYLSALDATARLGLTDKRPALRAFDALQERGFVTLAKEAHFETKAADTSRARCWRLTWHPWPECHQRAHRAPTNDWERYVTVDCTSKEAKAANRRADKRLRALARHRKDQSSGRLPGVKFTPLEDKLGNLPHVAGVKIAPAKAENGAIPPNVVGVKSPPYIDATMGMGRACGGEARRSPE